MARGAAQKRRQSAKPDARKRRPGGGARIAEQTLFFTRLRKQAKWVFVFLALVFAVGFVVFGVGSGSTGIGDILRGNFNFGGRSSSSPSIDKARKKVERSPNDAAAYLELARALEARGRAEEAIAPLEQYARLRPKDVSALTDLAGLYATRAVRLRDEFQRAQLDAQTVSGAQFVPTSGPLAQALSQDPITQAVSTSVNARLTDAATQAQAAFQATEQAYQRIAKLTPDDPNLQLQLAQAAQFAGDTPAAIAAYKRFLKLAPDDPSVPRVKQLIRLLQPASGSTSGG